MHALEHAIGLHLLLGRREDRLLFDYQNTLAGKYGFVSNDAKRASEQLMQEYYRNAKTIMQLNTILLQNMGAAIFPSAEHAPILINELPIASQRINQLMLAMNTN